MGNPCKECNGSGTVERNGKLFNCECYFVSENKRRMPPHIQKADICREHLDLPILRTLNGKFYVSGHYQDVKAVIKALMIKYQSKWIKLTTDAEIRNVYVGSMSKSSRSDEYQGEIYNSIQDLMDPPDLMIVHLGVITNKNKAAAGALEEALAHRINNDKPIWAFSTIESPFTTNSFAYSARVGELIDSGLHAFKIPRISSNESHETLFDNPKNEQNKLFDVEHVQGSNHEEKKPNFKSPPKHKMPEQERQPDVEDDPMSVWGSGVKKKKPFGGRS